MAAQSGTGTKDCSPHSRPTKSAAFAGSAFRKFTCNQTSISKAYKRIVEPCSPLICRGGSSAYSERFGLDVCAQERNEGRGGAHSTVGTAVKRRAAELQTEARANSFLDGSGRDEREQNAANRPRPKGGEGWPVGASRNGGNVGHGVVGSVASARG